MSAAPLPPSGASATPAGDAPVLDDVLAYRALLPGQGALIGLDPGTQTIGVAVTDTRRAIASPLETLRRGKFAQDAQRLAQMAQARAAVGLVIGLPRNMDGSEGPRCQSSRAFARNLSRRLPLPILLWDERLTTVAAERALLEADTSRRRRAEVIDHVAAGLILQGALDRLSYLAREETRDDR